MPLLVLHFKLRKTHNEKKESPKLASHIYFRPKENAVDLPVTKIDDEIYEMKGTFLGYVQITMIYDTIISFRIASYFQISPKPLMALN